MPQLVSAGSTSSSATAEKVGSPAGAEGDGFSEGYGILLHSDRALARDLDGMVAAGATWLRVDIDWSVVGRKRGTFDWTMPDRVVDAARARGLSVLGILAYTPRWARPASTGNKHPPSDPRTYVAFARAAAIHYRGVVSAFEIWNEPNSHNFWSPRPDPAAYTALLAPAYDAIKAVDGGAIVLSGGLGPAQDASDGRMIAPATFLRGVYQAGGGGSFDAVAHHPYTYPYSPTRSFEDYNDNAFGGVVPVLHDVMVQNGDGAKLIWATEIGAGVPLGFNEVKSTPRDLAAYVTEAFRTWRAWAWTGPMFWYSYRDAGTDPTDALDHFGVVRHDFKPKGPALDAMRSAMLGEVPAR